MFVSAAEWDLSSNTSSQQSFYLMRRYINPPYFIILISWRTVEALMRHEASSSNKDSLFSFFSLSVYSQLWHDGHAHLWTSVTMSAYWAGDDAVGLPAKQVLSVQIHSIRWLCVNYQNKHWGTNFKFGARCSLSIEGGNHRFLKFSSVLLQALSLSTLSLTSDARCI